MTRTRKGILAALIVAAAGLVATAAAAPPVASRAAVALLAGGVLLLLIWLAWRVLSAFLWKVGRRLAFSYFLIGVLPVPLVALLLGLATYILSGFFLGHLYRDSVHTLQAGLERAARDRLEDWARTGGLPARAAEPAEPAEPDTGFALYRGGRRVAGSAEAPVEWPAWVESAEGSGDSRREPSPRFFARADGSPGLAAGAARDGRGVLAFTTGPLDDRISRESGLWVETYRSDDPDLEMVSIEVGRRRAPLAPVRLDRRAGEAQKFFKELSEGERLWDDPILWWGEISPPVLDLGTGRPVAEYLAASLNATPRTVMRHLFSSSAEVDATVWVGLLVVASLLFDIYLVAALMAVVMIVSLSRAVNRLSRATDAVRRGDFSARIPSKRRDQLGELQRSFNEMTENLEILVATATQKELLEKELELARNLQKSLIPTDLPAGDGIEIATVFEPSAAIGGDYFDILRVSEHEIAVVIADVSGHGLSTGLRMAMLKSALSILVEETGDPEKILRRLDRVVRTSGERRFFVTATLGILDLATGALVLTNAGHPPTYLLREGRAEEILLPGSALGGLGTTYGRAERQLHPGDVVVWLSDGFIEAADRGDDPFGYDAVTDALTGLHGLGASAVRDHLVAAVARHTGGQPPSDDRTLVVLGYRGG
jgi:serine phosphatase RsbU (regulator of sigma subunit)